MLFGWKHAADDAVDDRIEDKVLHPGGPGKQGGVAQEHMVELMHYQHQEFLGAGRVLVNEFRVDQESWLNTALDSGSGYAGALHNVHQSQQPRQGIGAAGKGVQNPFGQ